MAITNECMKVDYKHMYKVYMKYFFIRQQLHIVMVQNPDNLWGKFNIFKIYSSGNK